MTAKQKVSDAEIRKLVIARLQRISSDRKISIGSEGEFTKEELIERVKDKDRVGQKITQIQMEYLRSLKQGVFLDE